MLVKLALAVGLIAYLVQGIDWRLAARYFANINLPLVGIAGLMLVAGYLVSSWKWQILLKAQGVDFPLKSLFANYWAGSFANNFLPTSFGGDVVRLTLCRGKDRLEIVAASMLVERLTGIFVLLLYVLLAACLWKFDVLLENSGYIVVFFVISGSLVYVFARLCSAFGQRIYGYEYLLLLVNAISSYKNSKKSVCISLLISFVFYFLVVFTHYTLLNAADVEIGLYDVFLVVPFVNLIAVVPVTINGIGLVEGATVYLYCIFGASQEQIFAVALLIRITQMVTSLPGCYFIFFNRKR